VITHNILSIIVWLPALGGLLILGLFKKEQNEVIKKFATAWLVLDFIASLWLFRYDRVLSGFQFLEDRTWIPIIGARYQMGVDGVSVLLIVLTTFLGVLAALSSWKYIAKREKEYYILLLLLQTMVLGRVHIDGHVSFLSVFRSRPRADVFPDRNLGRRESSLRGDQILSLHAGRFSRDAARDSEDVFPDAGHGPDAKIAPRLGIARRNKASGAGFEHAFKPRAEQHRHFQHLYMQAIGS
jgi:hypothetical protein